MKTQPFKLKLTSPLFTDWSDQYLRLHMAGTKPGAARQLSIGGAPVPFQYTGNASKKGAEILVKIGLAKGESKELVFSEAESATTDLSRMELPLRETATIGVSGRELRVGPTAPFAGFAGAPMRSAIRCDTAFEKASLARVNDGPLFTDYELEYRYAQNGLYALHFRCYKMDPYAEVAETFSLGLNAELIWTLNPERRFTHIISRDSFEVETQPTVEPLGAEHPRDLLCRLQMPVLSEYFIPNNRGWFAFCDENDQSTPMIGVMGLYGARWEEPVANMPEIFDKGGTVEWHASLTSGKRHWLLYSGPVAKEFHKCADGYQISETDVDGRFVFHRLNTEFNAFRLDEHLDLDGTAIFDGSCAHDPGVLGSGDFHARAVKRVEQYPCLKQAVENPDDWLKANGAMHLACFAYLADPSADNARALHGQLIVRFEKWVRQFQGYRIGMHDYMKNTIGFPRFLRGLLLGYEMLRRDGALSDEEIAKLNTYFAFAARRMLDEGRWPHSRTWQHPDHPESTRDFYAYGGEHKPDRLVWTNCLPNFQSDPLCALAHLSAIFKDHPDAAHWLRFALDDVDRQLDAYCGKSGAWEESINYAIGTLSYFVITFKVVKERWGIDYFNDQRMRRYISWLCRFMGPLDKRFGAFTMPGIGNSVIPQTGGECLLCYAAELDKDDPLRADCLAVWQRSEGSKHFSEHFLVVTAAMAPEPQAPMALRKLGSENMDEVGVAMRDRHTEPDESYLFQKIGFAKDHYEADESAFNWYAKGTPLCMDYGTYTPDTGVAGAHNVVEIADADALRRGYLADHLLTAALDYTRCEMPVSLKLLWGKMRSFEEIENKDGQIDRTKTPYFYIGDKNPVGPKVWKVRQMLFVKPDYLVIFDRVYGRVPHRYSLHVTGTEIRREGPAITAKGRYDLDLQAFVRHPAEFEMETGELIPSLHPAGGGEEARKNHSQHYFRIYNQMDGIYQTLLFARERTRHVILSGIGESAIKVVTPEYTDYVFLHNDFISEETEEAVFAGRAGWIRKWQDNRVQACLADGGVIQAFGRRFEGRGPWAYGVEGKDHLEVFGPTPRKVLAH